jgi:hypothetical protein
VVESHCNDFRQSRRTFIGAPAGAGEAMIADCNRAWINGRLQSAQL